jgi:ferritin-like metal-binding protein YciE
MSHQRTLHDLFHDHLKAMFFAEKKILDALPKMAQAARSGELRAAFKHHERQTREQIIRLREVFQEIGEAPQANTSSAILGIIQDGQECALEDKGTQALDAALIASGQAVEHFEIVEYGTLKSWAEQLELSHSAKLLDETLNEEKETDEKLSQIAESKANEHADRIYRVVRHVEVERDAHASEQNSRGDADSEFEVEEKGHRRVKSTIGRVR